MRGRIPGILGTGYATEGRLIPAPLGAPVFSGKEWMKLVPLASSHQRGIKHCFSEVGEAECRAAVNDARLHCCCSPPLLLSTSQDPRHEPHTLSFFPLSRPLLWDSILFLPQGLFPLNKQTRQAES